MTRRELLSAAAAVITGANYRNYSACLPDYLRGLAEAAYRKRNAVVAKLTTPAAIRERQAWVGETFWKLTGGMPERTPLNARTAGAFERPGYRVEKVVYESRPGLFISANLYIPAAGRPPYPGVLFQMGHTTNGKAGDLYQRCCQGLAQLGYVVLGFDPMGQGERIYYPGATPTQSRLGADEEHTAPGRQMLLFGDTSTRMQVWDSIRSLDYLAAHPLVDPRRLASTGQSGGGTTTMLLAAVDPRLAAAAAACPISENYACAGFNPPGSTDDAEQNFVGSGPLGFDRWDLLYPLAPKPLLVLVSDRDFFGTYSPNYITSGHEEFAKLHKVYETLGHGDRLAWHSTPLPHGLAYDMRLKIYNWFERWLKGVAEPVLEEPPTKPEPDAALWVTESGSVVRSLASETPFTLNRKRVTGNTPVRLDALLGVERAPARAVVLGRASFRNAGIEAIEVASAPGVFVPAWLFQPRQALPSKPLLLLLEPGGRTRWHEGELYDQLAQSGAVVCAPDLRGVGDLTPEFSRGAARHARPHNSDEHWAWASLILGKPLAGQRVTDILALVTALRARPELASRRLVVAAQGALTVPALFAAALEPAIGTLYLSGGLVSFRNLAGTEDYRHPFGNFVPRLLNHTDLPELAARLTPRRVVLAGAVDAAGRRMEASALRAVHSAASNVEVRAEQSWSAEDLLQV
ncbi:MAG: acetylxylan esterase [Acidobacteria bacterium]|nr:acetylxylan esterase [Acidobacteriota bacterium]